MIGKVEEECYDRRHKDLMGVIPIKRSVLSVTLILILFMFSACGAAHDDSGVPDDASSVTYIETPVIQETETTDNINSATHELGGSGSTEPEKSTMQPDTIEKEEELLQSASIDLNGDGRSEQVEAIRVLLKTQENGVNGETDGRLVIRDNGLEKVIQFCRKEDGLTGVMTSMEFEDLDGDGSSDVFIIIPGIGASFEHYNYFIYSYKKDSSHTFTSDNALADFIDGFESAYINGGNKLTITNEQYNFSANLTIDDVSENDLEETMLDYVDRTWIDPVSVNMGESSKLALVKNTASRPEIKVPMPIFGLATVDMIGEIDLYFSVDEEFKPVLQRFELLDFDGNEKIKVGSYNVR